MANEAESCLTKLLAQYDPFRCLSVCLSIFSFPAIVDMFLALRLMLPSLMSQVIVPLLVTEDEKTLVTCTNCLTKVCCVIRGVFDMCIHCMLSMILASYELFFFHRQRSNHIANNRWQCGLEA